MVALNQAQIQTKLSMLQSNIGKKVRVYRGPEVNAHWFVPWTKSWHIDGVITHVFAELGVIFYRILFDEGFEGVFEYEKKLVKYL